MKERVKKDIIKLKESKSERTTKIKDNKPERTRVTSGINNFDSMIEGGFPRYSTNLLMGSSGSGKSIFAIQFLIEGMKKGEKCLYITFEEEKEVFYLNMLKFGWDLAKFEKEKKFFFLQYTPEKVKTMLEEGGGAIENIVLSEQIQRIVIDSITSFELLFDKELEKRESALALFNIIRKWSCTSLLTYEDTPSNEAKSSPMTMEFEADSTILLYFIRGKSKRNRFLEILKMRGTKHSLSVHPFEITSLGIVVSSDNYEGPLN
jgi:circadian clock protein KaiC